MSRNSPFGSASILIAILTLFIVSCSRGSLNDPQEIIDRAIEASGGDLYTFCRVSFDFRDRSYVSIRNGGLFTYERIWDDSLGYIRDILSNEGFKRIIDGEEVPVADSMAVKYSNSVNSVIYFAMLPFGLNDPAVIKEYLGMGGINGQDYHKVRISFRQEGGGKDYQDIFIYWIDPENFYVDFFAYTYETDGGGARFREAYNARSVDGLRFLDYINYQPKEGDETPLVKFDSLYMAGSFEELSRIELENIEVELQ